MTYRVFLDFLVSRINPKIPALWGEGISSLLISLILLITMVSCGKKPADIPAVKTGSLKVYGVHNDNPTDSLTIEFDDILLGTFKNPHIITNIAAGEHKIFPSFNKLKGKSQLIRIEPEVLKELTLDLFLSAPYPGDLAPDFNFNDSENNEIKLIHNKDKVILLFFAHYT